MWLLAFLLSHSDAVDVTGDVISGRTFLEECKGRAKEIYGQQDAEHATMN
jgi:hypothetical protein